MYVQKSYFGTLDVSATASAPLGLPQSEQNLPVLAQPQEQTHCSVDPLSVFLISLQSDLITRFVNENKLSEIFPNNPNIQKKAETG